MAHRLLVPSCVIAIICAAAYPVRAQHIASVNLADSVRNEFLHAWNGYKSYAWGHDELKPLSKSYHDWYGVPFYMTALDALDTMILMGLTNEADITREYIATHLSFDRDVYVKNFEFTIRFLGGLLSCYQLTGDRRLLRLAIDLGDRLLHAFESPTGMPYVEVNLKTGAVRGNVSNPAEVGTLLVEFGTLSKLTRNARYYDVAKNALHQVYQRRSEIGLVGQAIDVTTGRWVDRESHVSGCIDSYYEYLVKSARLFNDRDCWLMWEESLRSVDTYLLDSASGNIWYGHADMENGSRMARHFGSLDAFFPAVLSLAGEELRAERLQESCLMMWNRYGIEPEEIDYATMEAVSPQYVLRPEIIESAYYLFKKTGDSKYRDMGKVFFDSLRTYCRTETGYAELSSVVTKERKDRMESFFLAETLKYLYLLFSPPETLDFTKVIFNTEAHPIRKIW